LHRLSSDVSQSHPTNFYFCFRSQTNAELAGIELTASGFSVVVDKSVKGHNWLCLASKEMIPQAAELASLRRRFSDLAKRLDGDYDGWEAEVNPEDGNELLRDNL
jgi:hypothetical protein